jgi:hypothetical protein
VVDLILQRTLVDVDPDLEALDELLITIPACGHVFTVETLDGHCAMTDYYRRDEKDERWIGLEVPPVGFRKPPTCPTCRAAITSPRYGRIFKRADLDILENNVAFNMSSAVQRVLQHIESLSAPDLESSLRSAGSDAKLRVFKPPQGNAKSRQKNQRALLQQTRQIPLKTPALEAGSREFHGASPAEAKAWRGIVAPLLVAYQDAINIAATRSAHTHAWEASFSYLYDKERQQALLDPDHAPRNLHEHAMRVATMRVGQPRPMADRRYLVEAFWLTINIRTTLAKVTRVWLESLCGRKGYPSESRHVWQLYLSFLYRSCTRDAQIALSIAESSGSHRQTVKTKLLVLRVDLEQFRFNVDIARGTNEFKDQRNELAERARIKSKSAHQLVAETLQEHLSFRRSNQEDEREWLSFNFERHAKTIFTEWEKLEKALINDTFYEPLSLEEMQDIVRSLNFCTCSPASWPIDTK